MSRLHSLMIHATPSECHLVMANVDESDRLFAFGRWFQGNSREVSFYDFVRCNESLQISGIELHTSSSRSDSFKVNPWFSSEGEIPAFEYRWRLKFERCESTNGWEQIATTNPYLCDSGTILLIIHIWQLEEVDYLRIKDVVENHRVVKRL